MSFVDNFIYDIERNERMSIVDNNYSYSISHRSALGLVAEIQRLREWEKNSIPEAKPGEHITTTAKRVAELGAKRFVHNDRVHKVSKYIDDYDGWTTHAERTSDGLYTAIVKDGNHGTRWTKPGFGSYSTAYTAGSQHLKGLRNA